MCGLLDQSSVGSIEVGLGSATPGLLVAGPLPPMVRVARMAVDGVSCVLPRGGVRGVGKYTLGLLPCTAVTSASVSAAVHVGVRECMRARVYARVCVALTIWRSCLHRWVRGLDSAGVSRHPTQDPPSPREVSQPFPLPYYAYACLLVCQGPLVDRRPCIADNLCWGFLGAGLHRISAR